MLQSPQALRHSEGQGTMPRKRTGTPYICEDCKRLEGNGDPQPPENFYVYPNGSPFPVCKRHYTARQNAKRSDRLKEAAKMDAYKESRRESDRRYRKANRDKYAEYQRNHRAEPKNAARAADRTRDWEQRNIDRRKATKRAWHLRKRASRTEVYVNIKESATGTFAGKRVQLLGDDAPAGMIVALHDGKREKIEVTDIDE